MEDIDFWESINNYDDEIISVFVKENILTRKLDEIESKEKKIIGDFGCGTGNAFKHIKKFEKIYACDFSKNMINKAEKKSEELKIKNIKFKNEDIKKVKLENKCDVIIAISSIFPKHNFEFDESLENIKKNLKKGGKIFITTSSLESRIFSFQLDADLLLKMGNNYNNILKYIRKKELRQNLSSFGYMPTKDNLIQKQWLKEELYFKLEKFNFKKITIEKLELDWEIQIKKEDYKNYPKLWLWLLEIED